MESRDWPNTVGIFLYGWTYIRNWWRLNRGQKSRYARVRCKGANPRYTQIWPKELIFSMYMYFYFLSTVNHLLVVFLYIQYYLFYFLSPAPLKECEPCPNLLLFILHRSDHEKTLDNANQFLLSLKTVPGIFWLSLQMLVWQEIIANAVQMATALGWLKVLF